MRIHTVPTLAAIALGLCLAGGTALAQDRGRDRDRDRDNDRGNVTRQDNDNHRGERRRGRDQQQQQAPQRQPQAQPPRQRGFDRTPGRFDRNVQNDRRDRDRNFRDRDRRDRNWGDRDRRDRNFGNNDRRRFGNNDRRRNAGWDRYRRNYDSPRRYRVGVYHAPRGYNYRRWHYGDRLPRAYYARNFWLTNFVIYGLFAPPPGLIWVRYGPDALLIDEYTGEVIQVRYNVFYD